MNKLLNIITHPNIVIISFFGILINGEGFGGFFLLYVLLGLPHGVIHALIALLGVVLLLVNYYKYKRKKKLIAQSLIEILAVILLMLSVFVFF
jgi:hypothetical protein